MPIWWQTQSLLSRPFNREKPRPLGSNCRMFSPLAFAHVLTGWLAGWKCASESFCLFFSFSPLSNETYGWGKDGCRGRGDTKTPDCLIIVGKFAEVLLLPSVPEQHITFVCLPDWLCPYCLTVFLLSQVCW